MVGACSLVIDADPSHCRNNGGTVACSAGLVCDQCIPSSSALSPSQDACVAPGDLSSCDLNTLGSSDGTTAGDDTTTDVSDGMVTTIELDGTTTTTTTTGPMTTGEPCMSNDDCGFPTEFCGEEGNCVNCAGVPAGSCIDVFPGQPLCDNGTCVQCIGSDTSECADTTPICNEAEQSCEGCDEHSDCGEAACNFFNGECLDDAVLYVGQGPGEQASLAAAFNIAETLDKVTIVVRQDVSAVLDIHNGLRLALLSDGGDEYDWDNGLGAGPQLTVSDGTAIVEGMRIAENSFTTEVGVELTGGSAWFSRTQIVGNGGGAIRAIGGEALVIRNSFIHTGNDDIALYIDGTNSVEVLYTTVAVEYAGARGIACAGMSGNAVTLRNSIVVARNFGDEIDCPGIAAEYNATEMDLGGTNTMIPEIESESGWNTWFLDADTGNFHLGLSGEMIFQVGLAQWQDGDPVVDIDGTENRPEGMMNNDRPGADVP